MAEEQSKSPDRDAGKKTTEPKQASEAKPAAAKPSAQDKPGPRPYDNDLIRRMRARFNEAVKDATLDRNQVIVVVEAPKLAEVCEYLRDEEKFDYLADLTAVDCYGQDRPYRFEVILNLYSMEHNQRLRLKVHGGEDTRCPSVSGIWSTADWLERECFDMFGIVFEGHPNLRRILLPDEWSGFPLRKDYDILKQDDRWVQENLGIESGQ